MNIPWWLIGLVPAGLMVFLAFEGIRSSLRTALILFTRRGLRSCCCWRSSSSATAATTGCRCTRSTPAASPNGFSGLTTGFVFAALSFVGFEAAATLGDEAREPRRIVPRAVLLSVLARRRRSTCSASGPRSSASARRRPTRSTAPSTPWNDLAATYASWMKWPVIIASVSSMFAVMINSSNGIVRILNTMGREGLLPRVARVHRPASACTPSHAVFATGALRGRRWRWSSARSAAASAIRSAARTSTATSASC